MNVATARSRDHTLLTDNDGKRRQGPALYMTSVLVRVMVSRTSHRLLRTWFVLRPCRIVNDLPFSRIINGLRLHRIFNARLRLSRFINVLRLNRVISDLRGPTL